MWTRQRLIVDSGYIFTNYAEANKIQRTEKGDEQRERGVTSDVDVVGQIEHYKDKAVKECHGQSQKADERDYSDRKPRERKYSVRRDLKELRECIARLSFNSLLSLISYADLFEPGVMSRFDIQKTPFRDDTFDVVVCNHVMEHVSDDSVAMREIRRILKPRGWAMLQVPIALALDRTIEDPTATTDEQRIERFGQEDHVRLYSRADYVTRLQAAGFNVTAESYPVALGSDKVQRFGLVEEEEVFICSKNS